MADAPGRLLDAASRIADGDGVDWMGITSTLVDQDELAIADELAIVQQIASGHRELHQLLPVAENTPAHLTPDRARWGHLDLLNVVGRGSYGIVYRAWDTRLERLVALKLFHGAANPDSVIQEGRMLARVRHENVVTVYGADVIDGVAGIWMELVHGETLDRIVKKSGPLPTKEAAAVGADIALALGAVHAAGLLHCDVKAQNVVRETSGRVVLMDLGASRLVPELRDLDQPITDVAGTPRYMAPELFIAGSSATKETDIYSLGVLIYYVATGQFPVDGRTLGELKRAHEALQIQPLQIARVDLPKAFTDIVARAIDRDPAMRPSSTTDVQLTLSALANEPEPAAERSWSRWLAAAKALINVRAKRTRRADGPRRKIESATLTNEALQTALANRRPIRHYSRQPVSASKLAGVLELTFSGQVQRQRINAYVLAWNVEGLSAGAYFYDNSARELIDLQIPITPKLVAPLLQQQTAFTNAAAIVIMSAEFERVLWPSPQNRAYRSAAIHAGHLGQTFALVATALGLAPFMTLSFSEQAIEDLLGLDGVRECAIYVAGVGMPDPYAAQASRRDQPA